MQVFGPHSDGQQHAMPELKVIPPAVLEVLYNVLYDGLDKSSAAGRLRWAARSICRDASDSGCPVERMLVELKPEWSMLLDSLHFPRGAERTEITNRFIGFCIEEYFRPGDAEVDDRRDDGLAGVAISDNRSDRRVKVGPSQGEASLSDRM